MFKTETFEPCLGQKLKWGWVGGGGGGGGGGGVASLSLQVATPLSIFQIFSIYIYNYSSQLEKLDFVL